MTPKRLRLVKGILNKVDNMGNIALADFKIYYETLIIKIPQHCHKYKTPKPTEQTRTSRIKYIHVWLVSVW